MWKYLIPVLLITDWAGALSCGPDSMETWALAQTDSRFPTECEVVAGWRGLDLICAGETLRLERER